jgi:hypothetical protein
MAVLRFATDQGVENGQHVAPVFHHPRKDAAELRFALGIFVPFGQNCGRNFDVATQLFRGMPAKEQTVEERGFALRKCEIRNHFGWQHGSDCRHSKNAVYSKLCPRQVGHSFWCHEPVTGRGVQNRHATERGLTGSNRT